MNYGLFTLLGIPTGLDAIRDVARAVQGTADTLEVDAPQIAGIIREAAQTVENLSIGLRERSLGEIAASVSDFARAEPVAFFGGAVLAGFILARLAKRGPPEPAADLAGMRSPMVIAGGDRVSPRARAL
jgi:hypothetical protein